MLIWRVLFFYLAPVGLTGAQFFPGEVMTPSPSLYMIIIYDYDDICRVILEINVIDSPLLDCLIVAAFGVVFFVGRVHLDGSGGGGGVL